MKQESTNREAHLDWWGSIHHDKAAELRTKYFPESFLISPDDIKAIYKKEACPTVDSKQGDVEGFTPGEWTIIKGGKTANVITVYGNSEQTIVAKIDGFGQEEKEANAKLIRSAPTLLKENEQLKQQLETGANQYAKSEAENLLLKEQVKILTEATQSVNSLNLHLYEKGTVGNRVYNKIQEALNQTKNIIV